MFIVFPTQQFFFLDDIIFCTHVGKQTEYSYHLTSIGCIQNAASNTYKCWGWSETTDTITFIYNDEGGDQIPAKFVTFGCLKFVTRQERKFRDNGVEKCVTRCNYDLEQICSDETSGYFLIQYTPVCINLHFKNAIYCIL